MSLYYQDEHVTLYHGDCMEIMPNLPLADLIITDPPYTARTHKQAKSNRGKNHGHSDIDFAPFTEQDLKDFFEIAATKTKRWLISSLDYAHAATLDQTPPTGFRTMRLGVWVKTNPMPQISADRPAQGWESIVYLHRDNNKPTWKGGGSAGNYVLASVQGEGHPTSKPLSMVRDWVSKFSDERDLVLDPFAGSGTTLRAAADLNRRAIGIELEEKYCEVIARRLQQQSLPLGI